MAGSAGVVFLSLKKVFKKKERNAVEDAENVGLLESLLEAGFEAPFAWQARLNRWELLWSEMGPRCAECVAYLPTFNIDLGEM